MKRLPFPLASLQKPSPLGLNPHMVDDLPSDARHFLEKLIEKADTADGYLDLTEIAVFFAKSPKPADIRAALQLLPLLYLAFDEADKPRMKQCLLRLFGVLAMSQFATVSAELIRPADGGLLLSAISALMLADADTAIDTFSHAADRIVCKKVISLRDTLRQHGVNGYLGAIDTLRFSTEADEMLPLAVAEMVEAGMMLSQLNVSQWPLERLRDVDKNNLDTVQEDNAFMPLLPCLLWALALA